MAWTVLGVLITFPPFFINIYTDIDSYGRDIPFAGMLWAMTLLFVGLEFLQSRKPGDQAFTRFYLHYTSPIQKTFYVMCNLASLAIFVLWLPQ